MLRWIFALFLALALPAQEVRIQVLASTDLHGCVLPQDTYSLKPEAKGWARLATLIRERRAANPNTLLLDCGDTLQGEPTNYVRNRLHPELPEPSLAVMNELGYAAMAVGNHDFDWGVATLRRAEKEARFPFLSANTVFASDGKPAFTPSITTEIAGVRVAVLGLTTPGVPRWTEPAAYAGLRFLDPVETARVWVPRLREKADLVIVAIHAGLGELPGRAGDADCALRLADEVPGIDLLLTGHTHQAIRTSHKQAPILQAQAHGRLLASAEFSMVRAGARWKVARTGTELLKPPVDGPGDPKVLELTATLRKETDAYLDTFATNLQVDLDGRWARIEDTPLMQLIHTVQRQATGAQLSATSVPPPRLFIPKGPTSIRQFWALMTYENRVAKIRITGAQLKAYLEHAASAFGFSHQPVLFARGMAFYDVDTVDGCGYTLDLTRPAGSRVKDLSYQGRPVALDQSFTLALNTYRLYGGSGYMAAIGFKGQPEFITDLGLRNLLFRHILARPTLAIEPSNSWRTVPYIDRERVLQESN
jgi:2',3'-cyclic-nucleotide 2'-phosphodiesterase/3'-nucleotidase